MLMDEIKKSHEGVKQRLEGDVAAGQDNAAQTIVQKPKADRSCHISEKMV